MERGGEVQLTLVEDLTRQCLQGTGATQLDAAEALHRSQRRGTEETDLPIVDHMQNAVPTFIVAPHLYGEDVDLAWFFSSPLEDNGWVISTHQFDEIGLRPAESLRGFMQSAIYSSLHATGLSACENSPCCMNNADGVEEMIATSMLLCPGCLRKLQLIGAMPDVPGGLRSLRDCLSGAGEGFSDDLQVRFAPTHTLSLTHHSFLTLVITCFSLLFSLFAGQELESWGVGPRA